MDRWLYWNPVESLFETAQELNPSVPGVKIKFRDCYTRVHLRADRSSVFVKSQRLDQDRGRVDKDTQAPAVHPGPADVHRCILLDHESLSVTVLAIVRSGR